MLLSNRDDFEISDEPLNGAAFFEECERRPRGDGEVALDARERAVGNEPTPDSSPPVAACFRRLSRVSTGPRTAALAALAGVAAAVLALGNSGLSGQPSRGTGEDRAASPGDRATGDYGSASRVRTARPAQRKRTVRRRRAARTETRRSDGTAARSTRGMRPGTRISEGIRNRPTSVPKATRTPASAPQDAAELEFGFER